ncbi:hypothetical protein OVA11_19250 [Caulobacter sp. SL161]|uniref:hypothetical protein n=1 Tax=Caulobacter sp. SL161 TaxID=2995156 RepID=UPI0022748A5F|nr:hypothetical protein [Caulobacter sp. SL161]MCY1649116.1 hypothetical protein [Caulobacter sp. SL161]
MDPFDHDPLNRNYRGPLRADGKHPYNSHWWAEGEDCWRLWTPAEHHLLGVVPLNNGAWLAGFCPAHYDPQYPDRAAAIRAVAADFLRTIRHRRASRQRIEHREAGRLTGFDHITRREEFRARAWLCRILHRELGTRGRWPRQAVRFRAAFYEEIARDEVKRLDRYVESWARQRAGLEPRKGKKEKSAYAARLSQERAKADAHYTQEKLEAMLRLGRCVARAERLRAAA